MVRDISSERSASAATARIMTRAAPSPRSRRQGSKPSRPEQYRKTRAYGASDRAIPGAAKPCTAADPHSIFWYGTIVVRSWAAGMNSPEIKSLARELGADLVGIASAATLNRFPPDPLHPQTPERISPYVKSVIVIVKRIPVGAFRCKTNTPVQYIDMLVLRKMDRIAYQIVEALEARGHPSFVTAAQETDWNYKRASYGRLSTRHLGIEAGLGTFGLEVNILTPEYGPRIYLTGILTELELEPYRPLTEQARIGESCSRCLIAFP